MDDEDYGTYLDFVRTINLQDLTEIEFKSNPAYNYVLEHVTKEQGIKYLNLIESEFPEITYNELRKFINCNDKYGDAVKCIFVTKSRKMLYCSPSNMRYIFQSLVILKYLKKNGCKRIVEVGTGYGGIFLAINSFAKLMGVSIDKYYMIDLPDVCILIENYLEINKCNIHIPYEVISADTFGANIEGGNLFLLSNYCLTELDEYKRNMYIKNLISKTEHGFILWQTFSGLRVEDAQMILDKSIISVEEEQPQTGPEHALNYFVYY